MLHPTGDDATFIFAAETARNRDKHFAKATTETLVFCPIFLVNVRIGVLFCSCRACISIEFSRKVSNSNIVSLFSY